MSTTPTEVLQTTAAALETTLAATETAAMETAAAAEGMLDIESIKVMMDGFDPAALLPDLAGLFDSLAPICRLAVMIGPILLVVMGFCYLFLSPREANYYFGYRCYFGMGSEYAWRFSQRLAGLLFGIIGVILTVVMFIITGRFAYMEVNAMVWQALKCLLAEAALALLAVLTVNISSALRFDRKGQHRRRKRK